MYCCADGVLIVALYCVCNIVCFVICVVCVRFFALCVWCCAFCFSRCMTRYAAYVLLQFDVTCVTWCVYVVCVL